jgi:hypothetical protein
VWLGYVGGSAPGLFVAFYALGASPVRGRPLVFAAIGVFVLHVLAMNAAMEAGYPGAPLFEVFWGVAWLVGDRVRRRRDGAARLDATSA